MAGVADDSIRRPERVPIDLWACTGETGCPRDPYPFPMACPYCGRPLEQLEVVTWPDR